MMKANKARVILSVVAATVCGAVASQPVVSNVTLAQQQGTHLITVDYETDGTGITTFQFKTNGVDICHSEIVRTVTGDINTLLLAGTHSFTWDAGRDFPERLTPNLTVEVTLWPTNNPPTYCAVTLVGSPFLFHWYGKESEVPFGVTDSRWKKDMLLLRKIPSTNGGTVQLGSPSTEPGRGGSAENLRTVSFTQPFYMAIYEVTQRQWQNISGTVRDMPSNWNNPDDWEERPVEQMSYNDIRGATTDTPTVNWPTTGHYVSPRSFMGQLRAKSGGLLEFDLPTEAQWEYACRAGTSGAWNNGTTITSSTVDEDPNLDVLGRYQRNGGQLPNTSGGWSNAPRGCFATNATAKVGSYLPNAWGIYDMHGNVSEWCLDWSISSTTDPSKIGPDPKGPVSGSNRVRKGAAFSSPASSVRSANRTSGTPDTRGNSYGIRITAPVELIMGALPLPALAPMGALPARGISAHRGENGVFPENTVVGLVEAVRLGAAQVEFDVRRTKDGRLIVIHDTTVDRTTNGSGLVSELTFAEIRALDAGIKKGAQFAGTQVPTLEEALDCLPRDIWINVHTAASNPAEIADIIIQKDRQHQAFMACGRSAALAVKAKHPNIMICNMQRRGDDVSLYIRETIEWGCEFLQLLKLGTPAEMKALKDAGVRINFFSARNPQHFRELVEAGVDFPLVDNTGTFLNIANELFGN